jgi:5-methylcytosine-specific restriction endonuclease McrA
MESVNDILGRVTPRKGASLPKRPVSSKPSIWELKDTSRLDQLRTMPYQDYLQTPEWQEKRGYALELALHRCQMCNSEKSLQVHHRTYERRGHEDLEDLTVLCKPCHEKHHNKHSAKEETSEHAHKFKITAKGQVTIRMCKGCGQSHALINGTDGYQWQIIKEL